MTGARPLLVVNPRAGGGRTGRVFGELRAPIERALGPIDVSFTNASGHAVEISEAAARAGRAVIVAVGGDGTLHEVANGVLRAGAGKATSIGFIGQGTGGDFRRSLGQEHRLDHYLAAIASGKSRAVDAGKLAYTDTGGRSQTRFFLNIVSAGMGGLVDRYVARTSKAAGGKVAYLAASAMALARCVEGHVTCEVTRGDATSTSRIRAYVIAVCNGRYFGSGMHVAPMAKLDDGQLEVVALGAPSKLALAMTAQKMYDAKHLRDRGTTTFACQKIALTLANESAAGLFLLDVDGEAIGGLPASIEVLPRALRVCA